MSVERLKRIQFRAWRRGFKELDLVMGPFADARLADLDEDALAAFEALLDAPDQSVYAWVCELEPTPPGFQTQVMDMIRRFHGGPQASGPGGARHG